MVLAKVAFSPVMGFIMPRQLGPTMRMLPWRAIFRICCSSAAPSGPVSLKPAEMMIAAWTPTATHSSMTPGTVLAGVTMTARSTGSGMADRLG